jgi:hypothetical protein
VARLIEISRLIRLTVVVYLCFAGWFFILAPWSAFWSVLVVPNAPWWLLRAIDNPGLRGALAGFGALHFPIAASWIRPARRAS